MLGRNLLLFAHGNHHRQQHRRRCVDRHADADFVERDAVQERFHVAQAGDRHADLADLALGERVVSVVADLRGQIEGNGETGLPLRNQELVASVALFGVAKTSILTHRPETPTIHIGLHTAREGIFTRQPQLFQVVAIVGGRRVDRFNDHVFGAGGEFGLALAKALDQRG